MVKENNRDDGDVKLFPKINGITSLLKNEPSTSHRSENWPSLRSILDRRHHRLLQLCRQPGFQYVRLSHNWYQLMEGIYHVQCWQSNSMSFCQIIFLGSIYLCLIRNRLLKHDSICLCIFFAFVYGILHLILFCNEYGNYQLTASICLQNVRQG